MDALTLKKLEFFMANFVENGRFFGSGMTFELVMFVLLVSRLSLSKLCKNVAFLVRFAFFMAYFVENGRFFGSGMT